MARIPQQIGLACHVHSRLLQYCSRQPSSWAYVVSEAYCKVFFHGTSWGKARVTGFHKEQHGLIMKHSFLCAIPNTKNMEAIRCQEITKGEDHGRANLTLSHRYPF